MVMITAAGQTHMVCWGSAQVAGRHAEQFYSAGGSNCVLVSERGLTKQDGAEVGAKVPVCEGCRDHQRHEQDADTVQRHAGSVPARSQLKPSAQRGPHTAS